MTQPMKSSQDCWQIKSTSKYGQQTFHPGKDFFLVGTRITTKVILSEFSIYSKFNISDTTSLEII